MHLQFIDWVIVVLSLLLCFVPALFFGKRAGKNTSEFFASGRSVPWWLAGLSMVATTFSSDTPNLVTDIVRRQGVAGNWVWWAFVLTGVSTVFFYARLWRRSGAGLLPAISLAEQLQTESESAPALDSHRPFRRHPLQTGAPGCFRRCPPARYRQPE